LAANACGAIDSARQAATTRIQDRLPVVEIAEMPMVFLLRGP